MLNVNFWLKKLIKEWIFASSLLGLVILSIYLKRFPHYDIGDFNVLFNLFLLFVVLKSVENAGLFEFARNLISGKFIKTKLVVLSAVLSLFVTNDVALLCTVPITIISNVEYKSIVVILQAIAVNALSSLLPTGNPQNMYIYLFYNLNLSEFIKSIYPLSITSFFISVLMAVVLDIIKTDSSQKQRNPVNKNLLISIVDLIFAILVVLKILPIYFGFLLLAYYAIYNRKAFLIDYILLATFFVFFGLTDNLKQVINIHLTYHNAVFITSTLLSQFMSNVPAALFLSDFTNKWQQLLWGVSVGGFGSLIGSLANLIAYRLYVVHVDSSAKFLIKFLILNYIFFTLGCGLYFIVH